MFLRTLLVAVIAGTLLSNNVKAQCVPDTTNFEFFSPAAEDLPCVIRNQPYQTVVQLFCPPVVASITLDSVKLTDILNLPVGFTYSSNPANGVVKANEHGCLLISGTTTDTIGRYYTQAKGFSYSSAGTISFDQLQGSGIVPDYFLDVFETQAACDGTTGISEQAASPLLFRYAQPTHQVWIGSTGIKPETSASYKLTDLAGRIVFAGNSSLSSSEALQLPEQLPVGTYCFTINAGGYSLSRLLVY